MPQVRRFNFWFAAQILSVFAIVSATGHWHWNLQRPKNLQFLMESADTALGQGEPEIAISRYERYLKQQPSDPAIKRRYGLLKARFDLANRRSSATTLALLEAAVAEEPSDIETRQLYIDYTSAQVPVNWHLVRQQLEILQRQSPTLQHQLQLALAEYRFGDLHAATALTEAIVARQPLQKPFGAESLESPSDTELATIIDAYALLAHLYKNRLHLPDRASSLMKQLLADYQNSAAAHLSYVRYLQTADDVQRSNVVSPAIARHLNLALQLALHDPQVLYVYAASANTAEAFSTAEQALVGYLEQSPLDAQGYRTWADLALRQHNPPEAIARLEQGLTQLPGHSELLEPLFDLYLQQLQLDAAEQTLAAFYASQVHPVRVGLRTAHLYLRKNQHLLAQQILQKIEGKFHLPPADTTRLHLLLGECAHLSSDFSTMQSHYQQAQALSPDSLPALLGTALARMHLGDSKQTVQLLQDAFPKISAQLLSQPQALERYLHLLIQATDRHQVPASESAAIHDSLQRSNTKIYSTVLEQSSPLTTSYWIAQAELLPPAAKTKAWPILSQLVRKQPDSLELWQLAMRHQLRHGSGSPEDRQQRVTQLLKLAQLEAPHLSQLLFQLQSAGVLTDSADSTRQKSIEEQLRVAELLQQCGLLNSTLAICQELVVAGNLSSEQQLHCLNLAVQSLEFENTVSARKQTQLVYDWLNNFQVTLAQAPLADQYQLQLLYAEFYRRSQPSSAQAIMLYQKLLAQPRLPVAVRAVAANNLAMLLAVEPDQAEQALAWAVAAQHAIGAHPALLDTKALILLATGDAQAALSQSQQAVTADPYCLRKQLHQHWIESYASSGLKQSAEPFAPSLIQPWFCRAEASWYRQLALQLNLPEPHGPKSVALKAS